jgi:hypothetical protein
VPAASRHVIPKVGTPVPQNELWSLAGINRNGLGFLKYAMVGDDLVVVVDLIHMRVVDVTHGRAMR